MRGTLRRACTGAVRCGIIPAYAGNTATGEYPLAGIRDHPRVCGEHTLRRIPSDCYQGSSPRMRGTPASCHRIAATRGIIPAYAGNTELPRDWRDTFWDHPRVCGEHQEKPAYRTRIEGSSPRMRGTRRAGPCCAGAVGIIPAYAGNTRRAQSSRPIQPDHPRVCGEHLVAMRQGWYQTGSSPRMRGTHDCCRLHTFRTGIIPAYAGNTRRCVSAWPVLWDHPRVCGEHHVYRIFKHPYEGSSPRMRGTLEHRVILFRETGIIPAYAGNTNALFSALVNVEDHPRVCGEHCQGLLVSSDDAGSSPRMRGTHSSGVYHVKDIGIIPAYAGNTPQAERPEPTRRDHPRVCGEHLLNRAAVTNLPGSSPRMRGTHPKTLHERR